MTATATALLGLVAWTAIMTFVLVLARLRAGTSGKPLNSFSPSGTDLDALGQRVTRAHANCQENLAVLAAPLLYALATDQAAITNGLAMAVLYARLAQSVVHMASGSVPAVLLRATAFGVQMTITLIFCWQLANAA